MIHLFKKKSKIYSPIGGKIIALKDINDGVFSEHILGDGIAIVYEKGNVFSPVKGQVTALVPSGHAVGITDENGVELIVHVGIETVNFQSISPFEYCVELGQKIMPGDTLIKVDEEKMKKIECNLASPIVFTNKNNKKFVQVSKIGETALEKETVLFEYN